MKYVITIQISKLEKSMPKIKLNKAFIFDDFGLAKKKFREEISELALSEKAFPFSRNKYRPLAEFTKDAEMKEDEPLVINEGKIDKFILDVNYEDKFEKDDWCFDDYTFFSNKNEVYYSIDGKILHLNALEMDNPNNSYYFSYKEVFNYEHEYMLSVSLYPVND